MRLDFVGVGPQRAGTSWLYANFLNHPEVSLPRPPVKETYFFDFNYERGLDWYARYFDSGDRTERVTGEFGPSYFDALEVPQRIHTVNSQCKIIISLRNPVDRTLSLFWLYLKYGLVPPDFDAAVQHMPRIITCNHYQQLVPRWAEIFGYDNIHFTVLDDIKSHPKQVLDEICEFLDISLFPEQAITQAKNQTSLPKYLWLHRLKSTIFRTAQRHHLYSVLWLGQEVSRRLPVALSGKSQKSDYPVLTAEQKNALNDLYAEDIAFVETLLQRSFDTWREDKRAAVAQPGNGSVLDVGMT